MNNVYPINEVMVIDDSKIDLIINSHVVKSMNVSNSINTLTSGVEAMHELLSRKNLNQPAPQLILLDIMMPNMNGLEFLGEFSKLPESFTQQVKIILVSSSLDKNDYDIAMKYKHVADFLNKPLTPQKLESAFIEIDIRR